MSTAKPGAEDAVIDALASHGDRTVAQIADAASLGRSTVGKVLARLEQSGRVRRCARKPQGGRRTPDLWSLPKRKETRRKASGDRLRPGQLDGLVLGYLKAHKSDGPLGPSAVAKGLGRSSGAVGNCLIRLAAASRVCQIGEQPRRYAAGRSGKEPVRAGRGEPADR
jgi:hypothetical protein